MDSKNSNEAKKIPFKANECSPVLLDINYLEIDRFIKNSINRSLIDMNLY